MASPTSNRAIWKLAGSSGRSNSSDYSSYGIGPSATYYFYEQGTNAFYVSQSINFSRQTNDGKTDSVNSGSTSLGVKLFLVPQVAFGIALYSSYALTSQEDYFNSTGLQGNFSFYY